MGLFEELGKELVGQFVNGALEALNDKADSSQSYNNNFTNLEKLYAMTIVYEFFLSDEEEGQCINPLKLEHDDFATFLAAFLKGLTTIDSVDSDNYTLDKLRSLLEGSSELFNQLMSNKNENVFNTMNKYERSELGLKTLLKFVKTNFKSEETRQNMVTAFTAMTFVYLLNGTSKCWTSSSYFRFYILVDQMNFNKKEILEIGERIYEKSDAQPSSIKEKINLRLSNGSQLYEDFKNLPKHSRERDLFDSKYSSVDSFDDLQEYLEKLQSYSFIKIAVFITSRKKELSKEEINFLVELLTDFYEPKEDIEEKIIEESKSIKEIESLSAYFKFTQELDLDTKKTLIELSLILVAKLIDDKISKKEKASPNYSYNFMLIKRYFKITNAEYEECLCALTTDWNIPAETVKNISRIFSPSEIDYIRENFPEICEKDDLDKAEKAREIKEKNEAEAARKQKLFSIKAAVATSYQEIFKGVDETYTNNVILSSHQEHMQKVIDFYGPDSTENPILAYDDTILNSGKKGFLLTDEKIHFTNDVQNGEITVLDIDEISDLTFKNGFVSPEICFNNCAVVTACLRSKYGVLVEKLLEATLAILKNGKNIQQKPIASTETVIQQNANASFCKACGAKIDAGAKFCKKCGHPVS